MEDWILMKIQDVILKSYQRDPRKSPDELFKYVDVSSVSKKRYCITECSTLKGEEAPSRARKIIEISDVIFATVRPTLMRIALITEDFNNEICSTGYCVLKPNQKKINPQFLYYSVLTDSFISKIEKLQRGASYPAIRDSDLKSQIINIPPLPEQRKISHVLNTIQKAIEQQDKLISTTTELKKTLMQKLFSEGTRGESQKETEIGLVPESWEVVELGKYAYIENGFAFKSEDYVKDGVPLIRISNVSHGYLIEKDNKYLPNSFLDTYSKFSLKNGDLIISLTRPVTTGGLKYCFIEQEHLPALLNQRVGRFQLKNSNKLSKKFLYHLVFSEYFVGELFRLFGNSSQQPNVSPSQLESFKVPIPKIEEQNQIAEVLFILNRKVKIAELRKQTLTELFKTLLHELMTGQRRVHELEFEKENGNA